MRVWLDDVREMPKDFDVWAKTAWEAIELLNSDLVTHISFDHDLGDEIFGTGYEVAKVIEEKAFCKTLNKLTWNIHSANPVGRQNIMAAMQNAEKFWRL